jgi:hypothetical protein
MCQAYEDGSGCQPHARTEFTLLPHTVAQAGPLRARSEQIPGSRRNHYPGTTGPCGLRYVQPWPAVWSVRWFRCCYRCLTYQRSIVSVCPFHDKVNCQQPGAGTSMSEG